MSFATDQILGMLADTRRHLEGQRVERVLGTQRATIDRLTQRRKATVKDKRALLEAHLHTVAGMACLQAEINALRNAVRELNPDHPTLRDDLMEAAVRAPTRARAFDSFRERADEFNAWLAR